MSDMTKEEMIDYLISTGLYDADEKHIERSLFYELLLIMDSDEMISVKDLVESFISTDKEYNGEPWNIQQILIRIWVNILKGRCANEVD